MLRKYSGLIIAGFCAGSINGLLGAGGGMILVPLLVLLTDLKEDSVFPVSVSTILPVCIISLILTWQKGVITINMLLPYLGGSILGGLLSGFLGKKIPTLWLHRVLGILILWGGLRYIW